MALLETLIFQIPYRAREFQKAIGVSVRGTAGEKLFFSGAARWH